jgi:MoaD family protein
MKVEVQFYSRLRDVVAQASQTREVAAGATVGDLLALLYRDYPRLTEWDAHLLLAVGLDYVKRDHALRDGDEVSVMPPVQGG